MKITIKLILTAAFIIAPFSPIFANDVSNEKETVSFVQVTQPENSDSQTYPQQIKEIHFQKIILSPTEKQNLINRLKDLKNPPAKITSMLLMTTTSLPAAVSLGMNGVPVLDQGRHGTCSIFAATGALDALYGHGDYISQVCYLQTTRENEADKGDWEGGNIWNVLATIKEEGAISISYQKQYGCGKLYDYPAFFSNYEEPLSSQDYMQHSEKIFNNLQMDPFFFYGDREEALQRVKAALSNNHRVVVGILVDAGSYSVGAYGSYHSPSLFSKQFLWKLISLIPGNDDSFILTPEIENNILNGRIKEGHALVITGYDDNAVITGPNNTQHRGVLTLRNSWGSSMGDYGDYYMSYDYFKVMAHVAVEVSWWGS